jgi:hypothetical protein
MKNIIIGLSVIGFVIIGTLLSLIALYASPDDKIHFTEASYIWIGNAIAIFGLLMYFRKN